MPLKSGAVIEKVRPSDIKQPQTTVFNEAEFVAGEAMKCGRNPGGERRGANPG